MVYRFYSFVESASSPERLQEKVQNRLNDYAIGNCKVDVQFSTGYDGFNELFLFSALVLIRQEVYT